MVSNSESIGLQFKLGEPIHGTTAELPMKPEHFMSDQAETYLEPGKRAEVSTEATTLTEDITGLVELSKGMALIIDCGKDDVSFDTLRGIKDDQIVKENEEMIKNVGNLEFTSMVNFNQISKLTKSNEQCKFHIL